MDAVTTFLQGLITVVTGLLLPATGALSPLQVLMWAGLIFAFIPLVIKLIRSLTKAGGGSKG